MQAIEEYEYYKMLRSGISRRQRPKESSMGDVGRAGLLLASGVWLVKQRDLTRDGRPLELALDRAIAFLHLQLFPL